MSRAPWDVYFADLARAAATRATCSRASVGTVLVKDRQVIATGYNGAISGAAHCDEADHVLVDGRCIRAVHSECNALFSAAKRGVSVEGATCYVTHFPCWNCFKSLAQSGVIRVVFLEWKSGGMTPAIYSLINESKVELVDLEGRRFSDIVAVKDGKITPE